jgi:hypothetical protein
MPTHEAAESFWRDWERLTAREQHRFRQAVGKFLADLERGVGFRPSLRVKGVRGAPGIYELTWAPDGRATFQYAQPVRADVHIVWRRIGTHDILRAP